MRKFLKLVLAWIVCLPFIVIFGVLNWLILPAEAYTQSGTTDPITFTINQTDFYGGTCANGRYASLSFYVSNQWWVAPFVSSDGTNPITLEVSAANLTQQGTTNVGLTLPASVSQTVPLCSDTGVIANEDWQAGDSFSTFIWNTGSTSTPETPTSTEMVSVSSIERLTVIMLLVAIFSVLLWKRVV